MVDFVGGRVLQKDPLEEVAVVMQKRVVPLDRKDGHLNDVPKPLVDVVHRHVEKQPNQRSVSDLGLETPCGVN
jgi:hypothetical protein